MVLIAYAQKSLLNVHDDVFSGARGSIIGLKILKILNDIFTCLIDERKYSKLPSMQIGNYIRCQSNLILLLPCQCFCPVNIRVYIFRLQHTCMHMIFFTGLYSSYQQTI